MSGIKKLVADAGPAVCRELSIKTNKAGVPKLISELYEGENVNHIRGKTKHLIGLCDANGLFEMRVLVLADVDAATFDDRGKEKNRQIEMLKRAIRNRFNPRFGDPDKQIFPLDRGVSHGHVVHSGDEPNDFAALENILERCSVVKGEYMYR